MAFIVPINLIRSNPNRNLEKFPCIPTKKARLKESIKETGFWDNIMVRPKGNMIDGVEVKSTEDINKIMKAKKTDRVWFEVEIPSGHHRVEAIQEMNADSAWPSIEEAELPVKFISDDHMLKMMIHENNAEYGGSVMTQIESVEQVYRTLLAQLDEFGEDDYAKYAATYGHLPNQKAFKKAKGSMGIGYATIMEYIGGEWPKTDIEGPLKAIKASDKGMVALEDLYDMSSSSALYESVGLIESIKNPDLRVPERIKDGWVKKYLELAKADKENGLTIQTIKNAKKKVAEGYDPIAYITKTASEKIDIEKLLLQDFKANEIKTEEELETLDGIEGYEGYAKAALDVLLGRIDAAVERERKKAEKEAKEKAEAEAAAAAKAAEDAARAAQGLPPAPDFPDSEDVKGDLLLDTIKQFPDFAIRGLTYFNLLEKAVSETEPEIRHVPLGFTAFVKDSIVAMGNILSLVDQTVEVSASNITTTNGSGPAVEPEPIKEETAPVTGKEKRQAVAAKNMEEITAKAAAAAAAAAAAK